MTLTIELTPEEEARLRAAAVREGSDVAELARALLTRNLPAMPLTGAEALAFWKREGVLGVFADRPDSPEYARELRRQAEQRGPLP